jgi:predicted TIM-barrel fold metal-dependent hydrolase
MYRAISSDSHLNEPLEIYERLPAALRARAPRLELRNGKRFMIVEGQPPRPLEAPNPLHEDDKRRYWRDESEGELGRVFHRAGGTDVALRLKDQDADGIGAEVIYPHGTFNTFTSPDPEFQLALARLYNDYYHEIFGDHPDRFVVSAIIPMGRVDAAIKEAQRVAGLGFRSLSIPMDVPGRPYNTAHYEPFWSAVEELGIPLALHIFTEAKTSERDTPVRAEPGEDLAFEVVDMAFAMKPLCLFVASGILERHPSLRFVLVECGIGWLAWVLQTLDQINEKRHMWINPRLSLKPSEYFKRQGAATFCDDEVGLRNRDITGVESLLWGNDYPHDEGTFPYSQSVIERVFKGVPAADKRKILRENAARLYRLKAAG